MRTEDWDEIIGDLCYDFKMTPRQVLALTLPQVHALNDARNRATTEGRSDGEG